MSDLQNRILRDVDKMPSLPNTVTKVLEVTQGHNISPHELNKVISLDPILTGKVLQLVNSAYYSLPSKVTSIVKAIILLGVNTIRNLALTSAVVPIVGTGGQGSWKVIKAEEYWKHSLGVGVTSKLIAKRLGIGTKTIEEYFIAGLLHDIGKVILEHNVPKKYDKVIEKCEIEGYIFIEAETEIIGLNHSQVGQMLAEKWQFSKSIEEVILHHHSPKECLEEHRQLVYSVSLANMFCNQNQIGNSGSSSEIYPIDKNLLSYLQLELRDFETLKPLIFDEIEKAHIFINAR